MSLDPQLKRIPSVLCVLLTVLSCGFVTCALAAMDDGMLVDRDGQQYEVSTYVRDASTRALVDYLRIKELAGAGRTREVLDKLLELVASNEDSVFLKLRKAEILSELNDIDEALAVVQEARQRDPRSASAAEIEGRLWLEKGETYDALECFQEALDVDPDYLPALQRAAMLYSHRSVHQWEQAVPLLIRLQKLDPAQRSAYAYNLAECYRSLGRNEEALKQFRAVYGERQSPAVCFQIAEILEDMGRLEEALEVVRQALVTRPGEELYLEAAARLCAQLDLQQEELDYLEQLITSEPGQPRSTRFLRRAGDLALALKQYDRAEQHYRAYLKVEPDDAAAKKLLAAALVQAGQTEEGNRIFSELSTVLPHDERLNMLLLVARVHGGVGEASEARQVLDEAQHDFGPDARIFLARGDVETDLENWDVAAAQYQQARDLSQDFNLPASMGLLRAELKRGDHQHAEKVQHEILEHCARVSDCDDDLLSIAEIWYDHNRGDLARGLLDGFLQSEPGNTSALLRMGDIAMLADDATAAQQYYQKALETAPEHGLAWQRMGALAGTKGDLDEARRYLEKAVEYSPDYWPLWFELGNVYANQEHDEKAVQAYQQALRASHADNARVLLSLGFVYDRLDMVEDAEKVARQAISAEPENADAYNFLGYIYAERDMKIGEAERLIKRALTLTPDDPNILDSMGWVYYRKGDYEQARSFLEQAVAIITENAEEMSLGAEAVVIFDHLGDVYQRLGSAEQACHWWRKAAECEPDNEEIRRKIEDAGLCGRKTASGSISAPTGE